MVEITAAQLRAARSLLDIEQSDLSDETGIAARTIIRAERGQSVRTETMAALQKALEKRGIEFIEENGGGAGVRLKKRARK